MKTFIALTTLLALATAAPQVKIERAGYGPSTLVRAPAHDSASIESHRLGGNFAYSTAEAHAFARVTPEISRATFPVAETTHVHQAAPIAKVQPAPIVKTHHAARPIFGEQPILAQQPVIGPVAAHTTVEQQVYKQQHVAIQPAAVAVAQAPIAQAPIAAGYAAATPALGYAGQPLAGYAGQPLAGYAGQPLAGYAGQPLAGYPAPIVA